MNRTKLYAIVTVLKKECPDLTESFSKCALTEIVKDKMAQYPHFVNNIGVIVTKCIESMENQLKSTHEDQKKLLQDCLEGDCEYPLEVIAEMTPRQKVNAWLIWNGFQGFTDDILDAISAAYDIILEPDLNR